MSEILTPAQVAEEALTGIAPGSVDSERVREMIVHVIEVDREQHATRDAVHADWARRIFVKLDTQLERVLTLYDVAKAIPHPYDALADYANSLAHDYTNSLMYDVSLFRGSLEGRR